MRNDGGLPQALFLRLVVGEEADHIRGKLVKVLAVDQSDVEAAGELGAEDVLSRAPARTA